MGPRLWSSGFLPNIYQGTYVPNNERTPEKLILNIRNESLSTADQERQLQLMDRLNRLYLGRSPAHPKLAAGVDAMEVAFRMQMEAPRHSISIRRASQREAATATRISGADVYWRGAW